MVVAVRDGARIVGAATGSPLGEHDAAFRDPLVAAGYDPGTVFYCAESVLLPEYRGRGLGHVFFDRREAHARVLGLDYAAFCAVIRPDDHPAKPKGYAPLDPFWRARGYRPLPGLTAHYAWRDLGLREDTEKPMQVWVRVL